MRTCFARSGRIRIHAHEETERVAIAWSHLARHPKCVGIGEAGLDYHYDKTRRATSPRGFSAPISRPPGKAGLPLVIHARDADADIAAILADEMGKGAFAGGSPLLHLVRRCLPRSHFRLGSHISFSGILTFKNSQAAAGDRPRGADGQAAGRNRRAYLAPVPYRGKRNEPAFVAAIAASIGRREGRLGATIAAETSANALRLFAKMPAPAIGAEAA